MGFYENAFRLLRECYAELNRDPHKCRIADWRDAFTPAPLVGVMDRSPRGEWLPWLALFPPAEGMPGDPLTNHNPFTIAAYLARLATMLRITIASAQMHRPDPELRARGSTVESATENSQSNCSTGHYTLGADEVAATIARLIKYGMLATVAGLSEAVALLEVALQTLPATQRKS